VRSRPLVERTGQQAHYPLVNHSGNGIGHGVGQPWPWSLPSLALELAIAGIAGGHCYLCHWVLPLPVSEGKCIGLHRPVQCNTFPLPKQTELGQWTLQEIP